MLNRLMDVVKNMMDGKNNKKLIENTVIVIIIGIIIIIAGSTFWGRNAEPKTQSQESRVQETYSTEAMAEDAAGMEKKLEEILSQIEGVGKVKVMITYESGEEIVPAYDITQRQSETLEKDNAGGSRSINESDYQSEVAYIDEAGGSKKPIITKSKQPVARGVIVVAQGAADLTVKENISKAVQVLMDIPIHKVQVFEMKR